MVKFWHVLREASGEGDYARYCAHLRAHHPDHPLPSEKQFYLERLKQKYARVSRCC
jgi:uncharacterized short protein YbdD (DUF466 family)